MRSFEKSRDGSVHLEWAVAFMIFMSGVILAMKLSETRFVETYSGMMSPDRIALMVMNTIAGLEKATPSYQFRAHLCNATYYRTSFEINNDSMVVCYQNALLIPIYYRPLTSRLEVSMNTTTPLVCIVSSYAPNHSCSSDIVVSSRTLKNSKEVVQYTPTSITSISYGGEELLASPVFLSTTSIESEENRCSYGYVDFGNTTLELDAYSPRLWIKSTTPNDYTFTLRRIFTEYFDGTATHTISTGLRVNLVTDIVSLYGDDVVASFIGRDMNVSMKVFSNRIEVSFVGIRKLELFLCSSNYTCALCEKDLFDLEGLKVNAPLSLNLVPVEELEVLDEQGYERLSQDLNLTGYHFNLTIANYSFGRRIPRYTNVWVRRFPINLLYKNGSMKVVTCTLSMWR